MRLFVSSILLCFPLLLWAVDFSGSYSASDAGESVNLTIFKLGPSHYGGSLKFEGETLALGGQVQGLSLVGEIDDHGEPFGFIAKFGADGRLLLTDEDGETRVFQHLDSNADSGHVGRPPDTQKYTASQVIVNRQPVTANQLKNLGQNYGLNIQPGRYWYDAACGAWGLEGGPTVGFIVANLDFPSPMPADISQGGTGIYINGREIHPMDEMGLQQLFGVTYMGRYWLDASGNLGPEGGPAIANLLVAISAAQQRNAQSGNGSVTHGYGTTGARGTVAGGMYSGRTASGKSVFWYPGM